MQQPNFSAFQLRLDAFGFVRTRIKRLVDECDGPNKECKKRGVLATSVRVYNLVGSRKS